MAGSDTDIKRETIDDLVVLGRAGPEFIQDGRHTVCLGGWSESKGFVRLYPTHKYSDARRWNVIEVPAEQDNSHDWRDESWKIVGSKREWDTLYEKIKRVDRLERERRIELTKEIPKTCPNKLNEEEKSMGLVEPAEIHSVELKPIENPDPVQTDMTGQKLKSKKSYPHKVYIEYTCSNCAAKGNHNQHCIEWGIYRFWDKNPDHDPDEVIDALRLRDDDYQKYFFIGNQHNNPTSFIVISVIRWKKADLEQTGLDMWT
ncbi:hypothetical protein [Halomicrococcus sp. SG-WS-1]|uniref:hypothetical protein n=1 Tax=Halomicrococcus sp. SG-WS-1 TaxID=3439057 RepID=UPI003F792CDC